MAQNMTGVHITKLILNENVTAEELEYVAKTRKKSPDPD